MEHGVGMVAAARGAIDQRQADELEAAGETRAERRERVAAERARDKAKRDAASAAVRASARARLEQLGKAGPEADLARLERKWARAMAEAETERQREATRARWSHKQATPETMEAIEAIPSRRRQWPIQRMFELGKISPEEKLAAEEIAGIVEMIERAASVGCASLEARVDFSGSARDQLVESLGRVRLEVAYRAWRSQIPNPRRMIIDMILTNTPYVRLAAKYGMHWRTARKRLVSALRLWGEVRMVTRAQIGREEVEAAYARLGEGELTQPRPRFLEPTMAGDEAA